MPKPSCSRPSQRDRQSMTIRSAAPSHSGSRLSRTRPVKVTGARWRATSFSRRPRSRPTPPMATVSDGKLSRSRRRTRGSACPCPCAARGARTTRRAARGRRRPGSGAPRGAARGCERVEPRVSTPGGTLRDRRQVLRGVAPAGPRLGVAARRGSDDLGVTQRPAQRRRRPAGIREAAPISAPCRTSPVGPPEARAEQPERPRRVEQHQVGVVARDRRLDGPAGRQGRQVEGLGGHPLDRHVGRAVERSASACETRSARPPGRARGGARAREVDWIPPVLGGKSLVTRRWRAIANHASHASVAVRYVDVLGGGIEVAAACPAR